MLTLGCVREEYQRVDEAAENYIDSLDKTVTFAVIYHQPKDQITWKEGMYVRMSAHHPL